VEFLHRKIKGLACKLGPKTRYFVRDYRGVTQSLQSNVTTVSQNRPRQQPAHLLSFIIHESFYCSSLHYFS